MGEKRKLERFTLSVPARLRFRGVEGTNESLETTTRNISAKGAYFRVIESEVPIGAEVEVELVLTFGRLRDLLAAAEHVTARVGGKVLRDEPGGVAVLFNQPLRFLPDQEDAFPRDTDVRNN
ncbi:MAG: hypothetical protein GVY14_01760 [Spirochaetes bacterium]|nr:hypothetical protein [Spirochaetota bacterium]